MKFTRLVPVLSLVAFFGTVVLASADSFDSETATIQKGGNDKTAKIIVGKETYMAPITSPTEPTGAR
jgi:hypothetical protein